jgi:outer membrane protein TolC
MKRTLCTFTALTVLICNTTISYSADTPPGKPLTMTEAIRQAAEKNLSIRAEIYNPAQYEADINRNRAIYDPVLALQASYNDNTSYSPILANQNTTSSSQSLALISSLSQRIWTGGTASLQFNNNYAQNNSSNTLAKYWSTDLSVNLSQPLLKNFGRDSNELAINISILSKGASIEKLNNSLLNLIAQVRTEYFKLYNLKEQLEIKKVSMQLADKILAETKSRVKAGVMPAMEIASAEFGSATREKELIDAEKAVKDQIDVLRLLLQLDEKDDLQISDSPKNDPLQINEEEAFKLILERPDIREQRRNLEIASLQTRVLRNRLLPDLTFTASAGLNGLDRSYSKDLEKVGSLDTPTWGFGLSLTYPFGNNAAENDYRKSRLQAGQIDLQIRYLEENARKELRSAIRSVVSGYKQIDVANRGRIYAEERLNAYIRKNQVGLATVKEVLDVENDLANAKGNQVAASANYDAAITRYWQVTGELLERENIRFVEGDADKLYKNVSN